MHVDFFNSVHTRFVLLVPSHTFLHHALVLMAYWLVNFPGKRLLSPADVSCWLVCLHQESPTKKRKVIQLLYHEQEVFKRENFHEFHGWRTPTKVFSTKPWVFSNPHCKLQGRFSLVILQPTHPLVTELHVCYYSSFSETR